MCFTPAISLTTFIIEFAVATFILIRYKNYLVPVFSAILIYVLGFYQFSEFMMCISANPFFWAAIGFSMYTFLPAIALHMTLRFTKKKFPSWVLYIIPIVYSVFALWKSDFVLGVFCFKVYVIVKNVLFLGDHYIFTTIYMVYYFGFIALMFFFLLKHLKNKHMSKIYSWWLVLGVITLAVPVFLILIFPAINSAFPSIYCEFALGLTIAAVAGSEIYFRKKRKEKF